MLYTLNIHIVFTLFLMFLWYTRCGNTPSGLGKISLAKGNFYPLAPKNRLPWGVFPQQTGESFLHRIEAICAIESRPILPRAYSPGPQRYSSNMLREEDVFLGLVSYN
jgi:hypothetical protein